MKSFVHTARSVIGWFRAVWPPQWIVVSIIATCGLCELIFLAARRAFGDFADPQQLHLPRDAVLLLGAAFYGVYRGVAFHPVFDPSYFDWLRTTPWKAGQPLPLGPLHIVAQDGVFVTLLLALGAIYPVLSPAAIPLVMLVAYSGAALAALCYTGPHWSAYALAFGLAFVGRCAWVSPWIALAAAVPVAIGSQLALSRSLSRFPWQDRLAGIAARFVQPWDSAQPRHKPQPLPPEGEFIDLLRLWPLSALHVDRRVRLLTRLDFVLLSLLAGCCVYCALAGISAFQDEDTVCTLLTALVVVTTAVLRLGCYTAQHCPPITFAGRLATGQWVIPAYDVVFLTPLAVVASGIAMRWLMWRCEASLGITLGFTTSVCLLIAFMGGPSRRLWQLTCPCRLTSAGTGAGRKTAEQL